MAQCAPAGREQPHPQLVVGGSADPEDREPGLGVGLDDADLVRPPVADRPEGIRLVPQELGAYGEDRAAFLADRRPCGGRPRGGTAPPHQPAHRRLHPIPRAPGPTATPYSGLPGCRRAVVATMLP